MNQIPQVVRMGSSKKKNIKKMKRGHGSLATEISQVAATAKATHVAPEGKEVHPVVIIYREKKKKKKNIKIGGFKVKRKRLKRMGMM